jgi:predicted secreted protein
MGLTLSWDGEELMEITSLSGPNSKIDTIDKTHYGSADNYREFMATFIDAGEVSLEGNFISGDTDGQIAMIADFQARSKKEAIITLPAASATTWTFDAIITSLTFSQPLDGKLGISATLKISGAATLGTTASTGMSACTGVEENGGGAITLAPAFAIGKFYYTTSVNTASGYIKLTPTAASHTITVISLGVKTTVATTEQSGEIAIGAADSCTLVTVQVYEAGKTVKVYRIYVYRPAP